MLDIDVAVSDPNVSGRYLCRRSVLRIGSSGLFALFGVGCGNQVKSGNCLNCGTRGQTCRDRSRSGADGPALGSVKNLALVGVGVGATIGIVGLVVPHVVAAGLSGLCGGVAAVALQFGVWTRRASRRCPQPE